MGAIRPAVSSVVQPIAQAIYAARVGGGGAPFTQMIDPTKPMPAFVEGWASNSFHAQNFSVPNGAANLTPDSEGAHILNMTVSGSVGATTLTGSSFDTANGTGAWSCSIPHDNGTYGIYTASGITSTTITISPPLRAATTGKNLASLGANALDQHYGLQGYKALANRIFSVTNQDGYRLRYVKAWRANGGVKGDWGLIGGLSSGGVNAGAYNAFPGAAGTNSYFTARGNRCLTFGPYATAGLGVSHTASLGGLSGFLETFVGPRLPAAGPVRVKVTIDGTVAYDQNLVALTRVVVPYTTATTGLLEISVATAVATCPAIGDTTWWTYDRSVTWASRVIGINDKVVVLGDSWSARYSGGLGIELAAAQTRAGGTTGSVTTVALSGQTAEWGLSQFASQVAPLSPSVVVIEFFVNDENSYGVSGYARWLTAMYTIGVQCQSIGARPIFVMPLPTQSLSQCALLGVWAELLGAGLSL